MYTESTLLYHFHIFFITVLKFYFSFLNLFYSLKCIEINLNYLPIMLYSQERNRKG